MYFGALNKTLKMFSDIQFALGVIFYYKNYGAGQALMVRDIKAITQTQKARRLYDGSM